MSLIVSYEWNDRHERGADQNSGVREDSHSLETTLNSRAAGLERLLERRIDVAEADDHAHPGAPVDRGEKVDVSGEQRRPLYDEQGEASVEHDFQHAARQPVSVFCRLLPVAASDDVRRKAD